MGEVVPWSRPAEVEFDGKALEKIAETASFAVRFNAVTKAACEHGRADVVAPVVEDYERIALKWEAILETIETLERHADEILAALEEGDLTVFEHSSAVVPLTVTSVLMRRCSTIRVQDFFLRSNANPAIQENSPRRLKRLTCAMKGGKMVCQLR